MKFPQNFIRKLQQITTPIPRKHNSMPQTKFKQISPENKYLQHKKNSTEFCEGVPLPHQTPLA